MIYSLISSLMISSLLSADPFPNKVVRDLGEWLPLALTNYHPDGSINLFAVLSADGSKALINRFTNFPASFDYNRGILDLATNQFTPILENDVTAPSLPSASLNDMSGDATVVVGQSAEKKPLIWTETTGIQTLTGLLGESFEGFASFISSNGKVVVGYNEEIDRPFRWTAEEGFTFFHDLNPKSYITGLSGDGSKMVGTQDFDVALLWTPTEGFSPLTDGTPSRLTYPLLSDDGSTIFALFEQSTGGFGTVKLGADGSRVVLPDQQVFFTSADGSTYIWYDYSGTGIGLRTFSGFGFTTPNGDEYSIGVLKNLYPSIAESLSSDGQTLLISGLGRNGYQSVAVTIPEVSSFFLLGLTCVFLFASGAFGVRRLQGIPRN